MSTLVLIALLTFGCRNKDDTGDTGTLVVTDDTATVAVDSDSGETGTEPIDADQDGYPVDVDCDDEDDAVHPDAPEACNGLDDDCDGRIDDEDDDLVDGQTWWLDGDGDGFGTTAWSQVACEAPEGFVDNAEDCDDDEADNHPEANERCDGQDNDCDDEVDENATDAGTWFADADGDGYGNALYTVDACEGDSAWVADDTDCDDLDAGVHPGASETCDGVDQDCDDEVDEDPTDGTTWYLDGDGDGYGRTEPTTSACEAPSGHADNPDDCDDNDATSYPGGVEVCDGADNDCNGTADDDPTDPDTFYADDDGDGFGDPETSLAACEAPAGAVDNADDCDDTDSSAHPLGTEVCDGVDNDCDGSTDGTDAVDAATWYTDGDGDGYGDPDSVAVGCEAPSGTVADDTDCDDADLTVHPGAAEVCNGGDDDCNGYVDEEDPDLTDATTFYLDYDGDGHGAGTVTTEACEAPSGYVADDTDCDDLDPAVNPDASEVCNGVDDDCDTLVDGDDPDGAADLSTWYLDADGDGYGDPDEATDDCEAPSGYVADDTDCDDDDADAWPGAPEGCDATADMNCDGSTTSLGAPAAVYGGSETEATSKVYQYSPVTAGDGELAASWSEVSGADSYEVAVGSTSGDTDVLDWTDVGDVTATTLTGLSLDGAWTGASYHLTVRSVRDGEGCDDSTTADAVWIAEAATWTGDVADLRAEDAVGGYTIDWPETGVDAVWGDHWFETVTLDASTTVRVQGWGAVDGVTEGIAATDAAVTDPADGWLGLHANTIEVAGTLTASGRGYGGGAGGGGGVSGRAALRGHGGEAGLGGDGAGSSGGSGSGGGGSPGGLGGTGDTNGGDGNLDGGGSGSTTCSGSDGRDGGDGASSDVGDVGGTASSGSAGSGGAGEFGPGGADGVVGCDNWTGGGGGGYGGGGSGGTQWGSDDAGGGGGGGAGGEGGGSSADGGAGAGPYGGTAGGGNSSAGSAGGYAASASNGDSSTDRTCALGSGGGGGGTGYQETGGGGGGAGGGAILLTATESLTVASGARILANGAAGAGGGRDDGGGSTSYSGGPGAGGCLVLEAPSVTLDAACPDLSVRGGTGLTSNGGTIKLFYDTLSGTTPNTTCAGRVHDGGSGSYEAP